MGIKKIDRLIGNTLKCTDCGKHYLPSAKSTELRGPCCNQKYMAACIRELNQEKLDYLAFKKSHPEEAYGTLVVDNSDEISEMFKDDQDVQEYLKVGNQMFQVIRELNETIKKDNLSFNQLYTHTFSADRTTSELATLIFHFKYRKNIRPDFLKEMNETVKYKFASSFQTTFLCLEILSKDKNNVIAEKAKKTLSIIKKL